MHRCQDMNDSRLDKRWIQGEHGEIVWVSTSLAKPVDAAMQRHLTVLEPAVYGSKRSLTRTDVQSQNQAQAG